MHKYIVWLCCKNSNYADFFEIVHADNIRDAEKQILNDKRFNNPVVTDVYPLKKEAKP